MNTLLTLGHGYCAAALSQRLLAQGWQVIGTCRDAARAPALAATGVTPLVWTAEQGCAGLEPAFAAATHVLLSASPVGGGDPFLTACPAILQARPAWVGYLSTTGVYGDTGGGWVDEDSPVNPARDRSGERVAAEQDWLQSGLPLHVFRLAGIYGPGRGPFQKLKDGTARRIIKPGQVFSRIHVDDIVTTLIASIQRPDPGRIYNLCDDLPSAAEEVVDHAAALLGIDPPPAIPFDQARMPPLARSFYEECRRVRNDRIKAELGVQLAYPTYREGLAAILQAENEKAG